MLLYALIIEVALEIMSTSDVSNEFPKTLKEFGYGFNKEGMFRQLDPDTGEPGDKPFEFRVSSNQHYNQRRYEAIGELVTEYVYSMLESECGLHRLPVPSEGKADLRTYVYVSSDIFKNPEKLMIIIHGSGVVRAGQWSRRLIMNTGMKEGSQIPYIKRAREEGYAVLVTNTNDNTRSVNGKQVSIKNSANPKDHLFYVWKTYVRESRCKNIAIVAHSYGGYITVELAKNKFSEFRERVFGVAFTDSVHSLSIQKVNRKAGEYLQSVSKNWVSSDSPLDTPEQAPENEIKRVSSGHGEHEMTSHTSLESVFTFLKDCFAARAAHVEL